MTEPVTGDSHRPSGHLRPEDEPRLSKLGEFEGRVGARVAVNFVDDALAPRYGTDTPGGGMIYIQVLPRKINAMRHE